MCSVCGSWTLGVLYPGYDTACTNAVVDRKLTRCRPYAGPHTLVELRSDLLLGAHSAYAAPQIQHQPGTAGTSLSIPLEILRTFLCNFPSKRSLFRSKAKRSDFVPHHIKAHIVPLAYSAP